jgi:hypothetical protein
VQAFVYPPRKPEVFEISGELKLDENLLRHAVLSGPVAGSSSYTASPNERIPCLQIREAREIAIGGPELGDAVGEAEGGDAGVMHFGAGDLPREKQSLEDRPVTGGLAQEYDARRSQESSHLPEGTLELRWRAVDLRMSGDGQEFMDARPGNSPWNIALDQRP